MSPSPRWISNGAIERLREAVELPDLSGTKYELVEPLARGGMGAIWLARDRELDRQVALKVLSSPGAAPGISQRMIREARILARLEHPGIVPVHDVGALPDGRIFYVMKHVRGRSLDQHPLLGAPLPERLRVMERICEAVAFAHDRGIVHRDLKPENIMVGEFGEVLIMDWGVAKILEAARAPGGASCAEAPAGPERDGEGTDHATRGPSRAAGRSPIDGPPGSGAVEAIAADSRAGEAIPGEERAREGVEGGGVFPGSGEAPTLPAVFTGHGSVLGTPAWMAPEQARGEVDRIDARADIYALGAILHFLLVGAPPSDARSPAEAIARFETGATGSPRAKSPSVARPLDAICRRAMAQDPDERYPLAAEMGQEIALHLAGQPPKAYREGILERAGRWGRIYRTAILLVLAYLLMRAGLFLWLGR